MKNKVKVTVVESYKVYQWKHYEVDEEIIVKQFGSLNHFERERPIAFMEKQIEYDIREIIEDNSEFEFHMGIKDISANGMAYDKNDNIEAKPVDGNS